MGDHYQWVKELLNQRTIEKIVRERKEEIDAHHALHQLGTKHNDRHKRKFKINHDDHDLEERGRSLPCSSNLHKNRKNVIFDICICRTRSSKKPRSTIGFRDDCSRSLPESRSCSNSGTYSSFHIDEAQATGLSPLFQCRGCTLLIRNLLYAIASPTSASSPSKSTCSGITRSDLRIPEQQF